MTPYPSHRPPMLQRPQHRPSALVRFQAHRMQTWELTKMSGGDWWRRARPFHAMQSIAVHPRGILPAATRKRKKEVSV